LEKLLLLAKSLLEHGVFLLVVFGSLLWVDEFLL
jgi:hypothetical protein